MDTGSAKPSGRGCLWNQRRPGPLSHQVFIKNLLRARPSQALALRPTRPGSPTSPGPGSAHLRTREGHAALASRAGTAGAGRELRKRGPSLRATRRDVPSPSHSPFSAPRAVGLSAHALRGVYPPPCPGSLTQPPGDAGGRRPAEPSTAGRPRTGPHQVSVPPLGVPAGIATPGATAGHTCPVIAVPNRPLREPEPAPLPHFRAPGPARLPRPPGPGPPEGGSRAATLGARRGGPGA